MQNVTAQRYNPELLRVFCCFFLITDKLYFLKCLFCVLQVVLEKSKSIDLEVVNRR